MQLAPKPNNSVSKRLTQVVNRNRLLLIMLVGLLLIAFISIYFVATNQQTKKDGTPMMVWQLVSDRSYFQNSNIEVEINAILITPKQMLVFYSTQSSTVKPPQIKANSSLFNDAGQTISPQPLTISQSQSLGSLGQSQVGVVYLNWIDRPGQSINLDFNFVGSTNTDAQLTLVKQLYSAKNQPSEFFLFNIAKDKVTTSDASNMFNGVASTGIFKLAIANNASNTPPLYIQVDRTTGNVKLIDSATFNALSGQLAITPLPSP